MDAGQGVLAAGFARIDGDHQTAIGEGRVVPALAHAVGAIVTGIADAGHDIPAGAHAKGEKFAIAGADRGAVLRSSKRWVSGVEAIAGLIDRGLRLLDAHPNLK